MFLKKNSTVGEFSLPDLKDGYRTRVIRSQNVAGIHGWPTAPHRELINGLVQNSAADGERKEGTSKWIVKGELVVHAKPTK